jgi:hypothetical protein
MNTVITNSPPITLYDLCDPTAVKETDFVNEVIRLVSHLYPNFHVFTFCPEVTDEEAVWKPDLAIVDKNLQFWFVVEVETASHNLEKHVLPQVQAFMRGDFAANSALLLARALGVSEKQGQTIMAYVPRDVIVIGNKIDGVWKSKLNSIGVHYLAIETYRNRVTAQTANRIDGDLIPAQRSIGFGQVRAIDRVITSKAGDFWKAGEYLITGPAGIANWTCVVADATAWLMKTSGILEFNDGAYVQFVQRLDGSVVVRSLY